MNKYDTEALAHINETIRILLTPFIFKHCLALLLPILIVYKINSGFLFMAFIVLAGVYARSGKLGFIFTWFIGTVTIIIFYLNPDIQHYIIDFLRSPMGRAYEVHSPEHIIKVVPQTLSGKIFLATVFGTFVGIVSRYVRGYHPFFDKYLS